MTLFLGYWYSQENTIHIDSAPNGFLIASPLNSLDLQTQSSLVLDRILLCARVSGFICKNGVFCCMPWRALRTGRKVVMDTNILRTTQDCKI